MTLRSDFEKDLLDQMIKRISCPQSGKILDVKNLKGIELSLWKKLNHFQLIPNENSEQKPSEATQTDRLHDFHKYNCINSIKARGANEYAAHLDYYLFDYDLTQTDGDGWTLLHYAACNNDAAVVTYLIKAGIDVKAKAKNGKTAFQVSAIKRNFDAQKILFDFESDTTKELCRSIQNGQCDSKLFNLLIKKADVNSSRDGCYMLHAAVSKWGNSAMVAALIQLGAEVNAKDSRGLTPLDRASEVKNNTNMVQLLLAAGAKSSRDTGELSLSWSDYKHHDVGEYYIIGLYGQLLAFCARQAFYDNCYRPEIHFFPEEPDPLMHSLLKPRIMAKQAIAVTKYEDNYKITYVNVKGVYKEVLLEFDASVKNNLETYVWKKPYHTHAQLKLDQADTDIALLPQEIYLACRRIPDFPIDCEDTSKLSINELQRCTSLVGKTINLPLASSLELKILKRKIVYDYTLFFRESNDFNAILSALEGIKNDPQCILKRERDFFRDDYGMCQSYTQVMVDGLKKLERLAARKNTLLSLQQLERVSTLYEEKPYRYTQHLLSFFGIGYEINKIIDTMYSNHFDRVIDYPMGA